MILDLEIKFTNEFGNEFTYQYGTHYLKKVGDKKEYEDVKLTKAQILDLKIQTQEQLQKILGG